MNRRDPNLPRLCYYTGLKAEKNDSGRLRIWLDLGKLLVREVVYKRGIAHR